MILSLSQGLRAARLRAACIRPACFSEGTFRRSCATAERGVPAALQFQHQKAGSFFQDGPRLQNQFDADNTLNEYIKRIVPKEVRHAFVPDLRNFGRRVTSDIYELHRACEASPPTLEQYDAWGARVDKIHTCAAWRQLHDISAAEGLVAIAYERKFGVHSRIYQVAKLYLFSASAGLYSCPLAMTDGAARTLELQLDGGRSGSSSNSSAHEAELKEAYEHLISRDAAKFWTSGQWMTERAGGSDVADGTETVAVKQDDGKYKLYGYKWFSSATDSDVALLLARCADSSGAVTAGTRGLATFFVRLRDGQGRLNGVQVTRLKDKLGTRQLPTAELLLDGCVATRLSEEGRGVAGIAHMLTVTRIHNCVAAAAAMRRITALAADYSRRRRAFGKWLCDHPLHVATLAQMEVETRAATLLVLDLARLLGLEECGAATADERHLLRLLTPVAKLFTAKQAVAVVSEGLECFGGQGYMEDTGLPAMLRDAQVLPIWEGTTNVLSLDVFRAMKSGGGGVVRSFLTECNRRLQAVALCDNQEVVACTELLSAAVQQVSRFVTGTDVTTTLWGQQVPELAARHLAIGLARVYAGVLLAEHASQTPSSDNNRTAMTRWCRDRPLLFGLDSVRSEDFRNACCAQNLQLVWPKGS